MIRFLLEFGAFVACMLAPLALFSVMMNALDQWFGFGWAVFGGLVVLVALAAFFDWLGER